jgi:hypothetical protein
MALTVLTVVGLPAASAYADATCYTGCSPTTTIATGSGGGQGGNGSGGQGGGGQNGRGGTRPPVTKGAGSGGAGSGGSGGTITTASNSSNSSGGVLPFTGADVEEMTAIGAGALLIGGILVRRSRNRRRIEA